MIVTESLDGITFRSPTLFLSQTVNGASGVFVREATADWSFNGDGNVAKIPATPAPTAFPWTGTKGVIIPNSWTLVTDGSSPDAVQGVTANQIGAHAVFERMIGSPPAAP